MSNSSDKDLINDLQGIMEKDFDNFLLAHFQQEKPYLEDGNFSARVMLNLPVAKKSIGWRERLIVLLPLMVISILVLSQNSVLAFAIKSWVMLSILSVDTLCKVLAAFSLLALLSTCYWFAKRSRLL